MSTAVKNFLAAALPIASAQRELIVMPSPPPTLNERAITIRKAHSDVEAALTTAAERALEAGIELKAAKDAVRHGEWEDYVAKCGISMRTAQNYMLIAKHKDKVRQLLAEKAQGNAYLSINALLKFVKMLDAKKKPKLKRSKLESPH